MNEIFKDLYEYAESISPKIDESSPGLLYVSYYTAKDLVEELDERYSEETNSLSYTSLRELATSRVLFKLFMIEVGEGCSDVNNIYDDIDYILQDADSIMADLRQEGWFIYNTDIEAFTIGDEYETLEPMPFWLTTKDKFLYSYNNMIFGHRTEQIAVNASPQVLRGVRPRSRAVNRAFSEQTAWE